MTFSVLGWVARYKGPFWRQVEAWDPQSGEAMVVSSVQGRLVAATELADFETLERTRRVAAVIPAAAGWTVQRSRLGEEEEEPALPIVAWLVDAAGGLTPVPAAEGDQVVYPATGGTQAEWVVPPGSAVDSGVPRDALVKRPAGGQGAQL